MYKIAFQEHILVNCYTQLGLVMELLNMKFVAVARVRKLLRGHGECLHMSYI